MWGTVVARTGEVCAVAFTGKDAGSQWPGSRVISAQKANTANAFGLPGLLGVTLAMAVPCGRSSPAYPVLAMAPHPERSAPTSPRCRRESVVLHFLRVAGSALTTASSTAASLQCGWLHAPVKVI